MYSLNVPLPGAVCQLADSLAGRLPRATRRRRGEHTLVVKRLGTDDRSSYDRLAARTRELLTGQPAFEVRVGGLGVFDAVPTGTAPVVYLAVESPELWALHDRLCAHFDPVVGIEGEDYVPHVTVARGGSLERAESLAQQPVASHEWAVTELIFWDGRRRQPAGSISLPA